ncbi:hypothetical protein QQ045_008323 [Rhodiola kirilowii]
MRDKTTWTGPCVCHALCVEGGMVAAAATVMFYGVDPKTSCLIFEGLFFTWWLCGIYTGIIRESLQKKYHLKIWWAGTGHPDTTRATLGQVNQTLPNIWVACRHMHPNHEQGPMHM